MMKGPDSLSGALDRLDRALSALDRAVDLAADGRRQSADADAEMQRLNVDRAKLAEELDRAVARSERLEEVNREVSRRLVTAMETIRAVLDR